MKKFSIDKKILADEKCSIDKNFSNDKKILDRQRNSHQETTGYFSIGKTILELWLSIPIPLIVCGVSCGKI